MAAKPYAIALFVLFKIIGLLLVAVLIFSFLFAGTGFTNIGVKATVLDATGHPLANEPVVFYSGIVLGAYSHAEKAATDQQGRFYVAFRKEYTITMLQSLLHLHQFAAPPFYFGIKLLNYDDGDPGRLNGHYHIVKVAPNRTTITAVKESKKALDKGEASKRLRVSARLSRDAEMWHIDATIRETLQ
jgi:Bacterial Ig-like domain (group 1).